MGQKPKRIVLTGGPCAGKTIFLKEAGKTYGHRVILVPEASTLLLSGNIPPPMGHADWPKSLVPGGTWRRAFQTQILATQKHLEASLYTLAIEVGAKVMICDRGILDGAAYWPEGLTDFARHFELDLAKVYNRYDLVIHLESVVVCNQEDFGRNNNPTRFEDSAEALMREQLSREVWAGHPNREIIKAGDFETKIRAALGAVARILNS